MLEVSFFSSTQVLNDFCPPIPPSVSAHDYRLPRVAEYRAVFTVTPTLAQSQGDINQKLMAGVKECKDGSLTARLDLSYDGWHISLLDLTDAESDISRFGSYWFQVRCKEIRARRLPVNEVETAAEAA